MASTPSDIVHEAAKEDSKTAVEVKQLTTVVYPAEFEDYFACSMFLYCTFSAR